MMVSVSQHEPATDDVVSHIATSGVHMSGPYMCVSVSVNVSEPYITYMRVSQCIYVCTIHMCVGQCKCV